MEPWPKKTCDLLGVYTCDIAAVRERERQERLSLLEAVGYLRNGGLDENALAVRILLDF